jgi:hypothetical protein
MVMFNRSVGIRGRGIPESKVHSGGAHMQNEGKGDGNVYRRALPFSLHIILGKTYTRNGPDNRD